MKPEKLLDACVKNITAIGWKDFNFSRVAEETNIPVSKFYDVFESRSVIPQAVIRKIDHDMLLELEGETFEDSSTRDVLFEIIMSRLEVAAPYKRFIGVLWREWPADMFSALMAATQGVGSMGWILDRAGLNTSGLGGVMRLQGLTILYLLTVKTWLEDDSEDMGKTMSFLDQGLGRVERIAKALNL